MILQVCDVISRWETALREKGLGKFENKKVIRFVYSNRLYWRKNVSGETERERLLLCYQTIDNISQGKFPVNRELSLELAALMSQVSFKFRKTLVSDGKTFQFQKNSVAKKIPIFHKSNNGEFEKNT